MSWTEALVKNCLAYSAVVVPVLFLVFYGHDLYPRLKYRSPVMAELLLWLIGSRFGSPLPILPLDEKTGPKTPYNNYFLSYLSHELQNKIFSLSSALPPQTTTVIRFIFCSLGLQISFLAWGVLQERMVTRSYNGRRFEDSVFFVFVNRCLAFVLGLLVVCLQRRCNSKASACNEANRSWVPLYKYMLAALSNVLATWFQYEALKFVSFPLQVLSKTCKIIAVMLVGKCLLAKYFSVSQYGIAVLVTFGVTLFVFGNEASTARQQKLPTIYGPLLQNGEYHRGETDHSQAILATGAFLLVCYLVFDSFTSNWEEQIFQYVLCSLIIKIPVIPSPFLVSSYEMMAGVNCWGTILTTTALLFHGGFSDAAIFMFESSEFTLHVLLLAISSATGNLFIYYTISSFGAVVFASIMTVRQALAILLSCMLYGHEITPAGLFGLALVFAALGFQTAIKCRQSKPPTKSADQNNYPSGQCHSPQTKTTKERHHILISLTQ